MSAVLRMAARAARRSAGPYTFCDTAWTWRPAARAEHASTTVDRERARPAREAPASASRNPVACALPDQAPSPCHPPVCRHVTPRCRGAPTMLRIVILNMGHIRHPILVRFRMHHDARKKKTRESDREKDRVRDSSQEGICSKESYEYKPLSQRTAGRCRDQQEDVRKELELSNVNFGLWA